VDTVYHTNGDLSRERWDFFKFGFIGQGREGHAGGKLLERSFPPDPLSRTFKTYNCYLTMVFKSFEDS
jgi:hypothetical protein